MEMGQWVMGHCQRPIDQWWWNNCTVACIFLFLVDIILLLTHPISLFFHSWRLNFNLPFFCSQDQEGCPVPPCHAPPSPMRRMKLCNGHGSWVMGHVGHRSTVWWVTWVMVHERWPISISVLRCFISVTSTSEKVWALNRGQKYVHRDHSTNSYEHTSRSWARHFWQKIYVWKMNKMPEFYVIFARKITTTFPIFCMTFSRRCPNFSWYLAEKNIFPKFVSK